MKKALILFLLLPVLLLNGCMSLFWTSMTSSQEDAVLASLGSYEKREYYTSGDITDSAKYAKYTYCSVDFDSNPYFQKMNHYQKRELMTHIDNFEAWSEAIEKYDPNNILSERYDFDTSVITMDDYVYIYDDPDSDYLWWYDVYYFDMETLTLYYFHKS